MSTVIEESKLAALENALPDLIRAAAQEVSLAEQCLAQALALRAAGERIKRAEISVARMALTRALRDADDLRRIQSVLPEMRELARAAARADSGRAVQQTWTGAKVVLHAGD